MDQPNAIKPLRKMDVDALRVTPLGHDHLGNEYWYFYGTRLYKQECSREMNNKDWKEEWNEQKNKSFSKRGRGRPRKKPKSDTESDLDSRSVNRNACLNIDEKSRWTVICNTFDDWIEFTARFKNSTKRCEKDLFNILKNQFLPVLNEMYLEKEKRLQEKLRELIPKPESTRMQTRKLRVTSNAINGYVSDDNAHRDYLARDRAQRLQKRNSRLNENVSEISRKSSCKRKYTEDNEKRGDVDEFLYDMDSSEKRNNVSMKKESSDLKKQIMKVLNEVTKTKGSWPFLLAVDEREAPGYYDIIKEPMDLSEINRKLHQGCYKRVIDVDSDFEKMVSNCKLYNGENSKLYQDSKNLWRIFRKGVSKLADDQNGIAKNEVPAMVDTQLPSLPNSNKSNEQNAERGRKKKMKIANQEALEMLSKEAELAVERYQNMDEDHLRNISHQAEHSSEFSDLKIFPIHSHPSSLIEKFMSDSSNQESDESNSENFVSFGNQSSRSSNFSVRDQNIFKGNSNAPANHYLQSSPENSNLSELVDKNISKNFNILSDGEVTELEMLSDSEIDSVPLSNDLPYSASEDYYNRASNNELIHDRSNVLEKCDDITILTRESDSPNTYPSRESMESVQSHNSSGSSFSGPRENSFNNSKPVERNTFLQNSFNTSGFSNFSSDNDISTIDASCLGLASSNVFFKKPQCGNVPVSSLGLNSYNSEECLNNCKSSVNHINTIATKYDQEISKNQSRDSVMSFSNQMTQDEDLKTVKYGLKSSSVFPPQVIKNLLPNNGPTIMPPTYHASFLNQPQAREQGKNLLIYAPPFISEQERKQYSPDFNVKKQSRFSFSSSEEISSLASHQPRYFLTSTTSNEVINAQENTKKHVDYNSASTNQEKRHDDFAKNKYYSILEKPNETPKRNLLKSHVFLSNKEVLGQEITNVQSRSTSLQKMQDLNFVKNLPGNNPDIFKNMQSQLDSEHSENQTVHSTTSSLNQEIHHQKQIKPSQSPTASMHSESRSPVGSKSQTNYCSIPSSRQENESQNLVGNQQRNLFPQQNLITAKVQARPSYLSYQQSVENQPRCPPLLSSYQQNEVPEHTKSQQICSPVLSTQQEMENQEPVCNQSSYSPIFALQGVKDQVLTKSQSRHSTNISSQQDSENQNLIETLQTNVSLSKYSEMENQRSSRNQPKFTQNVSPNQYMENQFSNQEPIKNSKRCSKNLLIQENQNQLHKCNVNNAHNQVPSCQFKVGNNSPNVSNYTDVSTHASFVIQSPASSNSAMVQTQMQDPAFTSNEPVVIEESDGNKLPTMKVSLPPLSGEIVVVPEKPQSSTMTFHLYAKPHAQHTQSTVKALHNNTSANNKMPQELTVFAKDQPTTDTNKIPSKQDIISLPDRLASPIEKLEVLASNPIGLHPSSNEISKNKNCDNISGLGNSTETSAKSASSGLSNSSSSIERLNPVHLRAPDFNGVNLVTAGHPTVYQGMVPRNVPLLFDNCNRPPNICGIVTATTNSVLTSHINAQRQSLPNSMLQNGNGQYVFLPISKEMPRENKNLNAKSKKSEKSSQEASVSPVFYPPHNSNLVQSYPFSNAQINGVPSQIYPQFQVPQLQNPFYINRESFKEFYKLCAVFKKKGILLVPFAYSKGVVLLLFQHSKGTFLYLLKNHIKIF
ncbi:cat eye syndrome critical region protein 2 [Nephila pilipes]|uniref:Cat eye syndrome critical region protein 2 n=1 Tax=Nephila pilipes TaxID=299642 RepID=A0A8X6QG84_NEPPI|nr:cat eye syndrome critical region protein 2 [Nephila pilipes]